MNFKIFEGHLWTQVIQQYFSIECEHHRAVIQIYQASNYITSLPDSSKMFIALMPALNLQNSITKTNQTKTFFTFEGLEHESYLETIKNKGLIIWSKILVREAARAGPAYSYLTCCYNLENMQEYSQIWNK